MICLPSGIHVYDLRDERDWRAGKVGKAGAGPKLTPPKPGVMLHQTAVEFSVSKQQLSRAGGDRGLALARRALDVGAHVTMFPGHAEHPPILALGAPFAWEVWHGNRANPETIGIEIAGRFEGVEGRAATLWQPKGRKVTPTRPTVEDVEAWQAGFAHVVGIAREEGHAAEWLVAHRQSSATRRSDPGSLVWKEVALWAESVIGMRLDRERVWGDGRPIPREWDALGVGAY